MLDGISDVVASLQDAEVRKQVIQPGAGDARSDGPSTDRDELISPDGLVAAALKHEDRMSDLSTDRAQWVNGIVMVQP